jgi:small conductance mechanosensitive channel
MSEFWQHIKILESVNWALVGTTAFHAVLILVLAFVVTRLLMRLTTLFRSRITSHLDDAERVRRIDTLVRVVRYVINVVMILVAGMLFLSELGVSIAPILGAAGVVGLAVGFGAQSLIKDYFTGFFLLAENQIRVGDVVEAGGRSGLVEELTLRFVRLRDYEGTVHFIPNNLITTVANMSRGFAYAVIDASVAYREDIDEAMGIIRSVGAELRRDPALGPRILGDLDMAGVDKWTDSAVIIRSRMMVVPLAQWDVKREFLKRLKKAFNAANIEIPYPHLTVYPGQHKEGTTHPLRVALVEGA